MESAGHEKEEEETCTEGKSDNVEEAGVESAAERRGRPRPRFGTTVGGGSTAVVVLRLAVSTAGEEMENEESDDEEEEKAV